MSSCATTAEQLMPRKGKYDRSVFCIKCKNNRGNVVVRHAVYCKSCFFPMVINKFRRRLDPYVNPNLDVPLTGSHNGNLLVGFSGGFGSSVALDILSSLYIHQSESTILREVKGHPRKGSIWTKAFACYVDTSSAFPGSSNRTNEAREIIRKHGAFEFVSAKLEDAFDGDWWRTVVGGDPPPELWVDFSQTRVMPQFANDPIDPTEALQIFLSRQPSSTARLSSISSLVRLILIYVAFKTNSSHLVLGTSLTSHSISLINSVACGAGFNLQEEQYQQVSAPPVVGDARPRKDFQPVTILRPLQDVGAKECAFWVWWSVLGVMVSDNGFTPGSKQTIGEITRGFILGLERDYPSTISTIARTCAKVQRKGEIMFECLICQRPSQGCYMSWDSRVSIDRFSANSGPVQSQNTFMDGLCYSCRGSCRNRGARYPSQDQSSHAVPLPVWARGLAPSSGEEV